MSAATFPTPNNPQPVPGDGETEPSPAPISSEPSDNHFAAAPAAPGANGKAQPTPLQGEHVVNDELLNDHSAKIDASPVAGENSLDAQVKIPPSSTAEGADDPQQRPSEPKSPEEKRAVEQLLLSLARTFVSQGITKTESIERLRKEATKYLMPDAAEKSYSAALGYPAEWYPRSLREIANRAWDKQHAVPWVIEGILPAESSLLCSGQPHATKSLDWLSACIEAAVKHTVWGKFDASNVKRTLYIETEDPDWMVENRIVALMKGFGLSPTDDLEKYGFYFAATGPFDLVEKELQIRALIDQIKPDFTVLSTLQGLIPGRSLNEQKDMSEPNAMVVRLSKLTPMVVITHSPRNVKAKRSYGTIVQDANYQTLLHFEKQQKNGTTTINVTGDSKLGTELDFKLRLVTEVAETTEVRGVFHTDYVPDTKAKVIACKTANPNMKIGEVATSVGCSYEYARKILKDTDTTGILA